MSSPLHGSTPRAASGAKRFATTVGLLATLAGSTLPMTTFCVFAAPARAAIAQDSPTARRTIHGKVADKNDAALQGAVVYLKDSRTLAVKSFLSNEEGGFHFGQLSTNTDYEVYAEYNGKRSKSRTISSFDSKNDFNLTLKIDIAP